MHTSNFTACVIDCGMQIYLKQLTLFDNKKPFNFFMSLLSLLMNLYNAPQTASEKTEFSLRSIFFILFSNIFLLLFCQLYVRLKTSEQNNQNARHNQFTYSSSDLIILFLVV